MKPLLQTSQALQCYQVRQLTAVTVSRHKSTPDCAHIMWRGEEGDIKVFCQGLPVHTLNNTSLPCKPQRDQDGAGSDCLICNVPAASTCCCLVPAKMSLAPVAHKAEEFA